MGCSLSVTVSPGFVIVVQQLCHLVKCENVENFIKNAIDFISWKN